MKHVFKIMAILPFLFYSSIAQQTQNSTAIQWQPPTQDTTTLPTPVATPVPPPQAMDKNLATYEDFLSGIDELAKSILPERKRLDSLKAVANAETPAPKDEFEKQTDYEKRIADFEIAKLQKITSLDQDYQAKTNASADKIKQSITGKEDFQPNWGGILKKDAGIEEYRERINKLSEKTLDMKTKISQISELLGKIYLSQKDTEDMQNSWQQKNILYLSRLERAGELMQDYIIQENAKILTSEKKKMEMNLGNYDAEKEEFEFSMNDSSSQTVPFDFSGSMKIPSAIARETNRQTDNFTANVDYINYPFIIGGEKLYPGAKKARVYYKDQEFAASGIFKGIQRFNGMDGYLEWALYADSLLSGKLTPKNLDSSYVMETTGVKIASGVSSHSDGGSSGSSFWTAKNTARIVAFGLSAASLGLGVWQNSKMESETKTAERLYLEASNAKNAQNESLFQQKKVAYEKSIDNFNKSENLRNGFYIGAGVFCIAGIVTFFF